MYAPPSPPPLLDPPLPPSEPPSSPVPLLPLLLVLLPLLEVLDPPPSSPELPELLVLPELLPLDEPLEEPLLEELLPESTHPLPDEDPELPPLEPPEPAPLEVPPASASATGDAACEHPAIGPAASNPDTTTNGITLMRRRLRKPRALGFLVAKATIFARSLGKLRPSSRRTPPLVLDGARSAPVPQRSPRAAVRRAEERRDRRASPTPVRLREPAEPAPPSCR
jgi:hypothetical protein